jgi:hypothetical protein
VITQIVGVELLFIFIYTPTTAQQTFNARESLACEDQSIRARYSLWHSSQQRFKPGEIAASPEFYSSTTEQRATSSGIPELRTVDQLRPNEAPHEPWSRHRLARKTANLSAACMPPHQKSCCSGHALPTGTPFAAAIVDFDDLDLSRTGRHRHHEEYLYDDHMSLPFSIRVQFLIN